VRLKESLFSFLGRSVEGKVVCDLFAGSGSLGLEALSRGASSVVFVERDRAALSCLRKNVHDLKAEDEVDIIENDVFGFITRCRSRQTVFDIAFADPGYGSGDAGRLLGFLDPVPHVISMLCLEHVKDENLNSVSDNTELIRTLITSDKRVSIFHFRGDK